MKKISILAVELTLILVFGCFSVFAEVDAVQVVCVGDSLTEGLVDTGALTHHYPRTLEHLLGEGYTVLGCGKSSASVSHARNGYIGTPEYKLSVSVPADYVAIMLGTNDAWSLDFTDNNDCALYETNYKRLLEKYRRCNPDVQIIMIAPPPLVGDTYAEHNAEIKNKIVPFVKELSIKYGCAYLDMYGHFEENYSGVSGIWAKDGVHFTETGYEIIAAKVKEKILDLEKTARVTADYLDGSHISVISTQNLISDIYGASYICNDGINLLTKVKIYENQALQANTSLVLDAAELAEGADEIRFLYFSPDGTHIPLAKFSVVGNRLENNYLKGNSLLFAGQTQGIMVTDNEGNLKYAAQQVVCEDGIYDFDLNVLENGDYQIYTGAQGKPVQELVTIK